MAGINIKMFYGINTFLVNIDACHLLVGPDLGSNCLQRLSADDTSW